MTDEFPYGLTEDEVEEFRELFDLIATDEKGVVGETIHLSDIPRLMELLGVGISQAEVLQAKFKEIDYDKSGDIDFEDEFLRVMSRKPSSKYSPEEVEWAFRTLCVTETGDTHTILRRDVQEGLRLYLDPPLPDLRIEDLLDHAQASLEDSDAVTGEHGNPQHGLQRMSSHSDNAKTIDFHAIIDIMNSN